MPKNIGITWWVSQITEGKYNTQAGPPSMNSIPETRQSPEPHGNRVRKPVATHHGKIWEMDAFPPNRRSPSHVGAFLAVAPIRGAKEGTEARQQATSESKKTVRRRADEPDARRHERQQTPEPTSQKTPGDRQNHEPTSDERQQTRDTQEIVRRKPEPGTSRRTG
jgi:hypothetical protein